MKISNNQYVLTLLRSLLILIILILTLPIWGSLGLIGLFFGLVFISSVPPVFWLTAVPICLAAFGPRLLRHLPLSKEERRLPRVHRQIALWWGVLCFGLMFVILTNVRATAVYEEAWGMMPQNQLPTMTELTLRLFLPPALHDYCLMQHPTSCREAQQALNFPRNRDATRSNTYTMTLGISFVVALTAGSLYLYYQKNGDMA